jgi:hypothetical protein
MSSEDIEILQNADLVFARVQSRRFPHKKYNVFYNKVDKVASCECDGWFNSAAKTEDGQGKCWHVDLLIQRVERPSET